MTEQEVKAEFVKLSAAQLKEFGVDGSPYVLNRFAVLVWKKLQPSITQYGDTREREGRIDELEKLEHHISNSGDEDEPMEEWESDISCRLAELKEKV